MAIRHAILGLLHCREMHGGEIKKQTERSFELVCTINCGRLHPNLKTLNNEDLISMKEVDHAGFGRQGFKSCFYYKTIKLPFNQGANENEVTTKEDI